MSKKKPAFAPAKPLEADAPKTPADLVSPSVYESGNYRMFFLWTAVLIFIVMIMVTPQYGVTGDEITQWNYGKAVWNYFKTFGADKTALGGIHDAYIEKKKLQYYGGFFDGFSAMLADIFKPKDEFLLRHYWNMIFGFLGILFTGLLARRVANNRWSVGLLALVLIALTPRFWGHSFNNPKDIPFATTSVIALYMIVMWLKGLDKLSWQRTILLGLAIALSLSVRIGGLLFLAYLVLFYAWQVWRLKLTADIGKHVKHLAVALLIGYFGCCLFWPYALEAPFSHPYEAYKVMADYPLGIRMLYEGQLNSITTLSNWYAVKMLGITLPLFLLIGLALTAMLIFIKEVRREHPYLWMILFAAIFPIAYIVYKHSVLYDGIRHVLFVIPPVVVCTAVSIHYLVMRYQHQQALKWSIIGGTALLAALPARFMLANHPNQYVYFNELTGGLKGAYGHYETDYYMNSVKQAYKWLLKHDPRVQNGIAPGDSLFLVTNTLEPVLEAYMRADRPRLKADYSRFYEKNQQNWDYAIYYSRFLDREQLQNGYFPNGKAIHVIEADGVPLCAVYKNDAARDGYKGYEALQQKNFPLAIAHLSKAATQYPKDMELYEYLSLAYAYSNQLDSAKWAIDQALKVSAISINTAFMAAQIYFAAAQAEGMAGNMPAAQASTTRGIQILQHLAEEKETGTDADFESPELQQINQMIQQGRQLQGALR